MKHFASSALRAAVAGGALLGAAAASQAAEYATVVSSTPVTAPVSVTQRMCANETQVVPAQQTGAGAVLGMIAGGVLGSTVGGGAGRALATGVGAMTGAVVGNQIEADTAARNGTEVPVQRCRNVASTEQRVVGYDVMYEYHGQRYSTRMSRDPGARVEVEVRPRDSGVPSPVADAQPVPAPQTAAAPAYAAPAYVAPAYPVYAAPVYTPYPYPVYSPWVVPSISLGIGYYGGYHRHWR